MAIAPTVPLNVVPNTRMVREPYREGDFLEVAPFVIQFHNLFVALLG